MSNSLETTSRGAPPIASYFRRDHFALSISSASRHMPSAVEIRAW